MLLQSQCVLLMLCRMCSLGLHIVGSYSLRNVYRREKESSKDQLLFLLNLALSDMVLDTMDLLRLQVLPLFGVYSTERRRTELESDLLITREAISGCVYYTTLGGIAVHRLMKLRWSYKYPLYCDKQKIIFFLKTIWLMALFFAIAHCVFHSYYRGSGEINLEVLVYKYFYAPFDVVLVCVFAGSCVYIVGQQIKSSTFNRKYARRGSTSARRRALLRNPRTYIPLFLGLSFLVFAVAPDIYIIITSKRDEPLGRVFRGEKAILSYVCNIILRMNDSLIYIFLHPAVRKFIWTKFRSCWQRRASIRRHRRVSNALVTSTVETIVSVRR